MTNYATLIDAPTWAFIRATGATYPPEIAPLTIADQRAIYDRMCRAFFQGYPAGITAQDQTLAGVNCRIYPGLGGETDRGSYLTHAHAPMLTRDDILFYNDIRHDGPMPLGDPRIAPLHDSDFTNLPPTVTFGAECDPHCDDARLYATALTAAGGRAHFVLEPGLVHGYMRARRTVPRAAASFTRITQAIASLAQGQWPYGDAT